MKREEWRGVRGWPYEVSDRGRVRRVAGGPGAVAGRILRPDVVRGYRQVTLSRVGRKRRLKVHRLVAMAFLPATNGRRREVNHIDGRKPNNRPSNLEWVTTLENHQHAARFGLVARGGRHGRAILTETQARKIKVLLARGLSGAAIGRLFGMSRAHISSINRGRIWRHV